MACGLGGGTALVPPAEPLRGECYTAAGDGGTYLWVHDFSVLYKIEELSISETVAGIGECLFLLFCFEGAGHSRWSDGDWGVCFYGLGAPADEDFGWADRAF